MKRKYRLGLLAYGTDTGLGIQTLNFYRNMKPDKVMLLDISQLNGEKVHDDWYRFDVRTKGMPNTAEINSFLDDLDLVFVCETPLNYYLFEAAQRRGIVTILQYNYEFLDYFRNPKLPKPTVFAAPSLWNIERMTPSIFEKLMQLPVPIEVRDLPQREIKTANHFFHVAGRPAIHDRNGTHDFIMAARMAHDIIPKAKFTLYCQSPTPQIRQQIQGSRIKLVENLPNYADLYKDGDVLVIPRKYGGLCLPLNEAIGCGIPTLMPAIDPNNRWLPAEWLLPVLPQKHQFAPRRIPITVHHTNVNKLSDRMIELYHHPEMVAAMHAQAKDMAKTMSWEAMKIKYERVFEECTFHLSRQ